MGEVTRRRFLANTSLGLGVAVTGLAAVSALDATARHGATPGSLPEPVILHVRDVTKGEVMILAGTTQVVITDPELVSHLVTAVGKAATRGAR
jgi:hypothetical protein